MLDPFQLKREELNTIRALFPFYSELLILNYNLYVYAYTYRYSNVAYIINQPKPVTYVRVCPIYLYYLFTSFLSLPISAKSRPVGADSANTPVRAGFASGAYTPANEPADGTTW